MYSFSSLVSCGDHRTPDCFQWPLGGRNWLLQRPEIRLAETVSFAALEPLSDGRVWIGGGYDDTGESTDIQRDL